MTGHQWLTLAEIEADPPKGGSGSVSVVDDETSVGRSFLSLTLAIRDELAPVIERICHETLRCFRGRYHTRVGRHLIWPIRNRRMDASGPRCRLDRIICAADDWRAVYQLSGFPFVRRATRRGRRLRLPLS